MAVSGSRCVYCFRQAHDLILCGISPVANRVKEKSLKTILFYFSGTGNSLAVAKQLRAGLNDAGIVSIMDKTALTAASQADRVGIVFPVCIWGVSPAVVRFLKAFSIPGSAYVFAVATCGGEGCSTIKQVGRILRKRGRKLDAGFEVPMVNNYVPFGIPSEEKQKKALSKAKELVSGIIKTVENRDRATHRGWVGLNWLLSGVVYTLCARWFSVMDKSFKVDDTCNGCEICRKVCPASNIEMQNKKPVWLHHCDQCWACLHWCPHHAIQMGKSTINKRRYRHPDVSIAELISR
jgi:ferredoxin